MQRPTAKHWAEFGNPDEEKEKGLRVRWFNTITRKLTETTKLTHRNSLSLNEKARKPAWI